VNFSIATSLRRFDRDPVVVAWSRASSRPRRVVDVASRRLL